MTPKVSVLMPAYNAERHVAEQLESVLAQDFGDFELLVLDDGSTDRTKEIIGSYASDQRVRLFHNDENRGPGAARNRLLREAQGTYVTPCDADDLMLPSNLTLLSRALDRHPGAGMVYGSFLMLETDESGRLTSAPWIRGKAHDTTWDFVEFAANHAGSMMRKSIVLDVGGYDEDVPTLDDISLTLKLAEVTGLMFLPGSVLYAYRRNPWSMTFRHHDWYPVFKRLVRAAMLRRGACSGGPMRDVDAAG